MRRFRIRLTETMEIIGQGCEMPDGTAAVYYFGAADATLYPNGTADICTTGRLAHNVEWIDDKRLGRYEYTPDPHILEAPAMPRLRVVELPSEQAADGSFTTPFFLILDQCSRVTAPEVASDFERPAKALGARGVIVTHLTIGLDSDL